MSDDKLQWGADEERYGHDSVDGPPDLDPEPSPDPARLSGLDAGDDGGAYSAPGLAGDEAEDDV